MNIGVLGTGIVAKSIAGKLDALGHAVKLGTRDVKATLGRNDPDMAGGPPLRTWLESHPKVTLATNTEAASHGEIVIIALNGAAAVDVAKSVSNELAGKVVMDISNPLDFSKGMPPSLLVANTDSLGEQIQRAVPDAKVVKTLNTVNCFLMVDPQTLAGGDHTMFLSGNDAGAKAQVTKVLTEWFGWKDVVDLGDLTNARGTEMFVVLWVRLYGKLGTANFNVKLVR